MKLKKKLKKFTRMKPNHGMALWQDEPAKFPQLCGVMMPR